VAVDGEPFEELISPDEQAQNFQPRDFCIIACAFSVVLNFKKLTESCLP